MTGISEGVRSCCSPIPCFPSSAHTRSGSTPSSVSSTRALRSGSRVPISKRSNRFMSVLPLSCGCRFAAQHLHDFRREQRLRPIIGPLQALLQHLALPKCEREVFHGFQLFYYPLHV